MFKNKKFWFKVLKRTFALFACVMVIFASSFSSYATSIASGQNFDIYLNVGSTPQVFPIAPISTIFQSDSYLTTSPIGYYSGFCTVNYFVQTTDITNSLISGYFYFFNDVSVYYRPQFPGGASVYDNFISVSVSDVTLFDSNGNSFSGLQVGSSYNAFIQNLVPTASYDVSYHVPNQFRVFCRFNDLYLNGNMFLLRVTYSISSGHPLTRFSINSCSVDSKSSISTRPFTGTELSELNQINQNLDSLENKTDTTNNKLQNLTDGFNNTQINNSNTSLNNSLTDYDTQEDEIISSATNFFEDIQTPISFFESGAFIAASSFVWQWLQGVYEHLGQAQVVVDVFLALTVAFSFVGLQKYIWRHSGRSSGGSVGKKGG